MSDVEDWLRARHYLKEHRYELGIAAAAEYPGIARIEGTPLLTSASWQPAEPVPLHQVAIEYNETAAPGSLPSGPVPAGHASYAEAVAALDAPTVFENRPTFRLTSADLGTDPRLTFTAGSYFDGVNTGEAAAHEFAPSQDGAGTVSLRQAVGNPCDLSRRPANMAISTLTLRHDRETGSLKFPLHWRDPARVGHAGGLHTVVPVGIFQPAGGTRRPDLWDSMLHEFAEELAGYPEHYDVPVDPAFAAKLDHVKAWVLGLGVDPLTFATDLLTAVVIDAETYDELFAGAARNDEGTVLSSREFTDETGTLPMQAASAALLALAARHKERLTSD